MNNVEVLVADVKTGKYQDVFPIEVQPFDIAKIGIIPDYLAMRMAEFPEQVVRMNQTGAQRVAKIFIATHLPDVIEAVAGTPLAEQLEVFRTSMVGT